MRIQLNPSDGTRALIVIPGTVNYFYNQCGVRIAEALNVLGVESEILTLSQVSPDRDYDLCIATNLTEILHAYGDRTAALARLSSLRRRSRVMAACAIDCARTPWYTSLHKLSNRCEADVILDLGLYDQTDLLHSKSRSKYRFLLSGLTPSETASLDTIQAHDATRTIPWAFVGHATSHRAALVDLLVQTVDPRGFVYMPAAAPYTEKGSPHLNQQQFEKVLTRTEYQVWCSHHHHFYLEPERFRASLLTGGVPIKVTLTSDRPPPKMPFDYLVLNIEQAVKQMQPKMFSDLRARYLAEWRSFPTLAQELARVFSLPTMITEQPTQLAA
ncbi:MAG: hypothetical protein K8U03_24160 [Planctomycetia bacterium]|nr:hypothetical protein [Planctomycetia bacterium]